MAGRAALVTGSGKGIGRAISQRLAKEGIAVGVADVDVDGAKETVKLIEASGGQAVAMACDVSQRAALRSAVETVVECFGRLDAMFNNAGVSLSKAFLDVTEADFDRLMAINAKGVLMGTQEAARQMIVQGGGGRIINTNSVAGKTGWPLVSAYSASKFAVTSLTQSAARALGPHKILVNSICPGVVDSALMREVDAQGSALGVASSEQSAADYSIVGSVAQPEDVAGLAVFLLSDDARFITGQSMQVDGGIVLQ